MCKLKYNQIIDVKAHPFKNLAKNVGYLIAVLLVAGLIAAPVIVAIHFIMKFW